MRDGRGHQGAGYLYAYGALLAWHACYERRCDTGNCADQVILTAYASAEGMTGKHCAQRGA
jgi:hypothetical protein